MSKFLKNRAFYCGFVLSIILFLFIQIYSYVDLVIKQEKLIHISGIDVDIIRFWDFPLPNFYGNNFVIFGIVGNILIALVFSFIAGSIFKFVWAKSLARKLR